MEFLFFFFCFVSPLFSLSRDLLVYRRDATRIGMRVRSRYVLARARAHRYAEQHEATRHTRFRSRIPSEDFSCKFAYKIDVNFCKTITTTIYVTIMLTKLAPPDGNSVDRGSLRARARSSFLEEKTDPTAILLSRYSFLEIFFFDATRTAGSEGS